jgi:hypothetical protein
MYFSYSVACYFACVVLTKNKNQSTGNKKKKQKQNLPPDEPVVGLTKQPFQLGVAASQPADTHTGPTATIAILPPLETAAGIQNGGSRLFLPTLNLTVYFRKIEEN